MNDQSKLKEAWKERSRLRAEADRLDIEGDKLRIGPDRLKAKANKLCAEVDKLIAEGELVFINAVIEVHGNVEIFWDWENGEEIVIVEGETYR